MTDGVGRDTYSYNVILSQYTIKSVFSGIQDLTAFKTVAESKNIIKMIDSGIIDIKKHIQQVASDNISSWISEE